MEKCIQYLRELAVLEVTYKDSNNKQSPVDSDHVQLTQSTWQKFVWSTPLLYTNSLALMSMKDNNEGFR